MFINKASDDAGVKITIPAPGLRLANMEQTLDVGLLIANKETGNAFPVACESGYGFQINNSQDTVITVRPGEFARHVPMLGLKNGSGIANLYYQISYPHVSSALYPVTLDFPS